MLSRIVSLFSPDPQLGATSADPQAERLRLATCVVLLEVAGADNEFSAAECQQVIAALRKRFELSQGEAEELVTAAESARADASGLWKFTNLINQSCTNAEKIDIIREVWRVVYADGALDGHEDHIMHQLARLLNLNHPQLIDAKMSVLAEVRG